MLKAIFSVVLNTLELHLKLLVAILKLLDGTGQLTKCIFHTVETNRKVTGIGLRDAARRHLLLRTLALLSLWLTAVEQIVEEISG